MLEELKMDVFTPLVGEEFRLDAQGEEPLEVVLSAVEPTPYGDPSTYEGRRMPFSLLFHARDGRHLPQQTFNLVHAALGETPLFAVPLGPDDVGMRYEAVIS